MTEFAETALRHYCRNPRCRMKLPAPVSNEREAFCTRGCYQSFYLHRCRVCEKPIDRTASTRKICKRSNCRNALAAGAGFGRFFAKRTRDPQNLERRQELAAAQAVLSGSRPVSKLYKPWRQIAGPPLTLGQLRAGTVPDRPDGQWKGGELERIEAKNRAALKAHFAELKAAEQSAIESNGYFTEPDWKEVVSPDGVKCFVTRFRDAVAPAPSANPPIPDDLSIPAFLTRRTND